MNEYSPKLFNSVIQENIIHANFGANWIIFSRFLFKFGNFCAKKYNFYSNFERKSSFLSHLSLNELLSNNPGQCNLSYIYIAVGRFFVRNVWPNGPWEWHIWGIVRKPHSHWVFLSNKMSIWTHIFVKKCKVRFYLWIFHLTSIIFFDMLKIKKCKNQRISHQKKVKKVTTTGTQCEAWVNVTSQ